MGIGSVKSQIHPADLLGLVMLDLTSANTTSWNVKAVNSGYDLPCRHSSGSQPSLLSCNLLSEQ